jgi:hypothetical protein
MASALETDPVRMDTASAESRHAVEQVERYVQRRLWGEAREALDRTYADLVVVAALHPVGRWGELRGLIDAGLQQDSDLLVRVRQARQALDQGGHPQEVIAILGGDTFDRCSVEAALAALAVRRDALTALVQRGEGGQAALAAVTQRMEALRRGGMEDDDA